MSLIPNIIHFIYPWTEKTRPWSLVNTLAVRLAKKHHPDYEIIVWTNSPTRVPLLGVTVKKCELPTQVGGVDIVWPQYISDVMRLQILLDWGGVYMDTDMLLMMDLNSHVKAAGEHNRLFMCWEDSSMTSVCNALMISPQENLFIKTWLDKIPEALQSSTWAEGGVVLPAKLAMNPYLGEHRAILHHSFACPLDLSKNWMFDPSLKQEAKERVGCAHAIHIFETFWRDIIKDITPEWIEKNDCLFSELILEYL
jgi:hypothetical protein